MPFWPMFLLFVGFTVLGDLLRPKPKFDAPKPSSLGDFQFPTATEDRAIPVVWGRCLVKGGNTVWYGDLQVKPITKRVRTGLFSKKTITTGHRYNLGMQMGICRGVIDEVVSLRFAGKTAPIVVATDTNYFGVAVTETGESLFGGEEKEGGVSGQIKVYRGTSTQTYSSYLSSFFTGPTPAYRGLCYAVFESFYWGTSQYVKAPEWEVGRYPNQLGLTGGKNRIGNDANPACMLYEALTDIEGFLGIPSAQIDVANFQSVGDTLYTEGAGLSMTVDSSAEAAEIINDILNHIDAVMYTDPSTGLITLKLARDDYTPAALPLFDESNCDDVEFSRGSWSETKNVVKVAYVDRAADYADRLAQQQDTANIQARGGVMAVERMEYRGISTAAYANKVAARALKSLAHPIARVRMVANRQAWALRPGSVFRWSSEDYGITEMVLRVVRISYGELTAGRITIEAVEDIFSLADTAYSSPADSEWADPVGAADPVHAQALLEVPHYLLGAEERRVMALAARANGIDQGYQVWSDPAGGTSYALTATGDSFTPTGTLVSGYDVNTAAVDTVGFTVENGKDLDRLADMSAADVAAGEQLAYLSTGEIVGWEGVTDNGDGTYTITGVHRGMLDTVPLAHSAGARVWFFAPYGTALTQEGVLGSDTTVAAKLLPFNTRETVAIGSATATSVTTASRAWKPLPPGNAKVNAVSYPATVYGDATLTWAHRNRLQQNLERTLDDQDDASDPAGPEGTYTVEVYVGGDLKATYSGLTGTSQAYTAVARAAADTDGTKATRFRIIPVNGSYAGTVRDVDFVMTGMGMTLGQHLGGSQG